MEKLWATKPLLVKYSGTALLSTQMLKEDCKLTCHANCTCDDLMHLFVCFRLSQCFLCVWHSHQTLYVCCSSQCNGCSLQPAHMCGYSTSGTQVRATHLFISHVHPAINVLVFFVLMCLKSNIKLTVDWSVVSEHSWLDSFDISVIDNLKPTCRQCQPGLL